MKPGFSALELAVSIAIGAMILSQGFMIYQYIGKTGSLVQTYAQTDTQALIIYARIHKDITGLVPCIPVSKKTPAVTPTQTTQESSQPNIPKPLVENHQKETPAQQHMLIAESMQDTNLYYCSFLSLNPLEVYDAVTHAPKRIVYLLKKDDQRDNSFILLRKELTDLQLPPKEKLLEPSSFIELGSDLASCSLTFEYIDTTDDKTITLKTTSDWNKEPQEKDMIEQKEKEQKPALPYCITLRISIWNSSLQTKKEYEFSINIPLQYQLFSQSKHAGVHHG